MVGKAVAVLVCLLAVVTGATEHWTSSFQSSRFFQGYRIADDGKIWAESQVTINAAPGRVWHEVQGRWLWWIDGGKEALSDTNETFVAAERVLSDARLFQARLKLDFGAAAFAVERRVQGELVGTVTGPVTLSVEPHPLFQRRSILSLRLEGGVRSSYLMGSDLVAKTLLWGCRGDLSWYGHVRGFSGLIRKLEGFLGSRYDLLDDSQLDEFVANHSDTLLWSPRLDTNVGSDEHLTAAAHRFIDLHTAFSEEELPLTDKDGQAEDRGFFLQFLLQQDPEATHDSSFEGGWTLRSTVKINFLTGSALEDDEVSVNKSPLSFVFEGTELSMRLALDQMDEFGSVVPFKVQLVVGVVPAAPPGEMRHVRMAFGANWTVRVTIGEGKPVTVVIPDEFRDELGGESIAGLEVRSNVRTLLEHVFVTDNVELFNNMTYFSSRKALSVRDAHSLAASSGLARSGSVPPFSWSTLLLLSVLLVGVPLLVARLASFDSSLIPKKGFDKPLLYFRLAPSAALTHYAVAASGIICLVMAVVFRSRGSFPTLVYALTLHSPEVLLWRVAVTVLVVQRVVEAYLGFKTYLDKLTEKSFRVAFPLFDFQYWLWMNRISLVANVLETISLLVMSLSSPLKEPRLQHVAWMLFHIFHLIHVVSHFLTFSEIKRSYQDGLVARLRMAVNACLATVLGGVTLRVAHSALGLAGLESAAALSEWAFLAVNFYWHAITQEEFIAPEDTRLYVGRRIAFGSSVRCSECFRPFSRTRPRETCADCRDECCSDCGRDVHMTELGSVVDMMCFFCGKCHRLLLAEVNAARNRSLLKPTARPTTSSLEASANGGVEVCRMYQRGECTYGDTCKYQHLERRPRADSQRRGRGQSGAPSRPLPAVNHPHSHHQQQQQQQHVSNHNSSAEAGRWQTVSPRRTSVPPEVEPRDGRSSLESSSDVPGLSRKKHSRGRRGQRKKKHAGTTTASDTDGNPADMDDDESDEPEKQRDRLP